MTAGARALRRLALPVAASLVSAAATANAATDTCARSRDVLLGGLAGELPQPPQSYKQLFTMCIAVADMANIKDAYVLKDGGIGVVAKNESVGATAAALSEFCQRFPRATFRFISQSELSRSATVTRTVGISSGGSTSCRKIRGLAAY
jgi:hypothetical protein